eukprot:gnl/MRDRNA2_/MRDRNA2_193624_c0_seq1.p2 gnl/MRDRNA2_/MRDRNA2_193624_c0~~gnl/MRDRNA2_/MRDRNA2_193624_c0_seq1.p2  ORF type:complete len:110 (-),score=16.12 gnl/MRDRNA2_/MRDRNA2_193624_c0_seq1:85-414(-)
MESLIKHTVQAVNAREIGARELSNIAYGIARSMQAEQMGVLFVSLARASAECANHFNAQSIPNVAWAFAKAGQPDVELFMALARMAERRVTEFNVQGLTNTAWAFATAG